MDDKQHILNRCVIPKNIVSVADKLCSPQHDIEDDITDYDLKCLSILIEAIVLYDEVIVYDFMSPSMPITLYSRYEDGPLFTHLGSGSQSCFRYTDAFQGMSFEERMALTEKLYGTFRVGEIHPLAGRLYELGEYRTTLSPTDAEDLVRLSLSIQGVPNEMEDLQPTVQTKFIFEYVCKHMWHTDLIRKVADMTEATGIFILPHWEPFWTRERGQILSALHEKVKDAQMLMLSKYLGDYAQIDVSPLTIIALDGTLQPERLPETIVLMRRDYSELRETGSHFNAMLAEAETYREVSNIVKDWTLAWDATLKRIGTSPVPLIRRFFSWDILKKGSAKDIFINSIDVLWQVRHDLKLRKGLSSVGMLEQEFLWSHTVQSRLKQLYGDLYTGKEKMRH